MISNGKRSHIMRLWREHHDIERVATLAKVPFDDCEAYIASRIKGVRDAHREFGIYGQHGPEPKITLPRLKFLEGL